MTRNAILFSAIILSFLVFFAAESFARHGIMWGGGGGWGMGTSYNRMYNPQTVETVSGEVVSINEITPMKGMSNGVHMMVATGKKTISVHVGPEWFIANQDMMVVAGDKVEVKGSRIIFDGEPAIVAAEIKKGDHVLMLRNADGIPAWCGWRRQ